ncbi:MAG: magnesium transporter CorA family protein [Oscillospiraceae bacterium]|nr:magnesium transporter CorA family protein [Oscillospiraceae bacterium]
MKGFDFVSEKSFDTHIPTLTDKSRFLLMCNAGELNDLLDVFGWDNDTVDECTNLDEKVRFTNYEDFDFISIIYAELGVKGIVQREVNLFFSNNYLTLVLPETPGASLTKLAEKLWSAIPVAAGRPFPLAYLYYVIFDNLTSYYSDSLEVLENKIEALTDSIEMTVNKEQLLEIMPMRKKAYTYKKLLRALSYVGDQVLIDEHNFLDSSQHRYFRDVDTRLAKLHDFADSLYVMSNDLLNLYDSKFNAQVNESVRKLTMITLFFGPPTVIAGIYGMNFINMPELKWNFGYPMSLLIMFATGIVIYGFLKLKKWL